MRIFIIIVVSWMGMGMTTGALGQKAFTVIYRYQEAGREKDSFYFPILKPMGQLKEDLYYSGGIKSFAKVGNEATSTCVFSVGDTTCALILDLFGHESFVLPGDSVRIDFTPMPKVNTRYYIDSQYLSPWQHYFVYSGKNHYVYSLFDSLAYHYGPVSGYFARGVGVRGAKGNLDSFFNAATRLYADRLAYLRKYASAYHITGRIFELAASEIRSAYIIQLTQPMTNATDSFGLRNYPQVYIDTMNSWSPDRWDLFLTTENYSLTAYRYIRYYKVQLLTGLGDRTALFEKTFQAIDERYTLGPLKEYLLAQCLLENMRTSDSSFISMLGKYKSDFPASVNIRFIDSVYAEQVNRGSIPLERAMACNLTDTLGRNSNMASNLGHKPILVDCWASWCLPCLMQMPYTKELEKKYGSKIAFVYLSFDRDRNAWLAKDRKLQFGGSSYLLDGEFKSDFALHFDITSIPRYLIFDKDGKLVTDNAPRPSRGEALERILDKLSN
jgi:thiol-disulfide isomerase/thioredoxin